MNSDRATPSTLLEPFNPDEWSKRLNLTGQPLPTKLRNNVEMLSGFDMKEVKVYYDSPLPSAVGAKAFAFGSDVHLGPGAEATLPHELWHIVQQKEGRVAADRVERGLATNEDFNLEMEAEAMGFVSVSLKRCTKSFRPALRHERAFRPPVLQKYIQIGREKYNPSTIWKVLEKYQLNRNTNDDLQPCIDRLDERNKNYGTEKNLIEILMAEEFDATQGFSNSNRQILAAYGFTSSNTPSLAQVLLGFYKENIGFRNAGELIREFKIRVFGYRHLELMEQLRKEQEPGVQEFVEMNKEANLINKPSDIPHLLRRVSSRSGILEETKRSSKRKLNVESAVNQELNFIAWDNPIQMGHPAKYPYYQWIRGRKRYNKVKRMNCWECVLFAAARNEELISKNYILWAFQSKECKTLSFRKDTTDTVKIPQFIAELYNNESIYSVHHEVSKNNPKRLGRENYPHTPEYIPPGQIILLEGANHVALSSGKRVLIKDQMAKDLYGNYGNEIIELDKDTTSIQKTTMEDSIVTKGFTSEYHLGWLPDSNRPFRYKDQTLNPTDLYGINGDA